MNGPTLNEVEAAVRAVLEELLRRAGPATAEASPEGAGYFPGRLLALRHVEALPAGTREVRVEPGTVLTPLARDQLKRQGIAVRLVSRGELDRAGLRGEWGLAIEDGFPLADPLRRSLLEERDAWLDVGPEASSVARWVAAAAHRGAVVVTSEAAVATWRACQVPGARAAAVTDPEAVARACRGLGANLLVIEPAGQSIFSMKHLIATFRRSGVPMPPAWWSPPPAAGGVHADRRGDRTGHAVPPAPGPEACAVRDRLTPAARGAHGWLAPAR